MPDPQRLSRRVAYSGKILKVNMDRVALPNGREVELEFIEHPGASAVVPLHADGTVTLIRQFRYATGGYILEVPAGKLDPGETPEQCARREVEEEAGVRPGALHPLGAIWTTPGFTNERIWLFAATQLTEGEQDLQHDEVLDVVRMPLREALALVERGELPDGKSLAALVRTDQELRAGRLRL
ncbi:MAG TPA: NUDIX hydrolase [Planctomycetota bacterium]|nr:NUDIX hydrolase [Planctomycetota bacterium]